MRTYGHLVFVAIIILAVLTTLEKGAGAGDLSITPREELWVTGGNVRTVLRVMNRIYIGGLFAYVGPSTGNGVPIDCVTGRAVSPYPKVTGNVDACVPNGSGD